MPIRANLMWEPLYNKFIPDKVILLIVITVLLSTIVVDYAKARDCNCKKRNGSLDNITFYIARSDRAEVNVHKYCTLWTCRYRVHKTWLVVSVLWTGQINSIYKSRVPYLHIQHQCRICSWKKDLVQAKIIVSSWVLQSTLKLLKFHIDPILTEVWPL